MSAPFFLLLCKETSLLNCNLEARPIFEEAKIYTQKNIRKRVKRTNTESKVSTACDWLGWVEQKYDEPSTLWTWWMNKETNGKKGLNKSWLNTQEMTQQWLKLMTFRCADDCSRWESGDCRAAEGPGRNKHSSVRSVVYHVISFHEHKGAADCHFSLPFDAALDRDVRLVKIYVRVGWIYSRCTERKLSIT